MSSKRGNRSLRIEMLESRTLPASLALTFLLDAACDGDPAEWSERHRELTEVAGEQICYWVQPRPSNQILDVFGEPADPPVVAPEADVVSHSALTKAPEYCEAIDGLIGEAAATEVIRYLDQTEAGGHLDGQYEMLVDQALQQLQSPDDDAAK